MFRVKKASLQVSAIECAAVDFPDNSTALVIEDTLYHLTGSGLAASFSFHFHVATSIASSSGGVPPS